LLNGFCVEIILSDCVFVANLLIITACRKRAVDIVEKFFGACSKNEQVVDENILYPVYFVSSLLLHAGDFRPAYINMVRASAVFCYPDNDDPVNFGESNAIACAFSMIFEAYNQSH
jgi:hypothetical protein